VKAVLIINIVGAIVAAFFGFVAVLFTELDVTRNYVELDRAGVINTPALKSFHPSHGFCTDEMAHRSTVPRFIAGPALDREQSNAVLMLLLALANVTVAIVAMSLQRTDAARQHTSTNDGQPTADPSP
jgi:hypothetical protein